MFAFLFRFLFPVVLCLPVFFFLLGVCLGTHCRCHSDSLKLLSNFLSMLPISFAPTLLSTVIVGSFHAYPLWCASNVTYTSVFGKHAIGFSFCCFRLPSVLMFLIFGCIALIFPVFSFIVFLLLVIRSCLLVCYFGPDPWGCGCERNTGFWVEEDVCRHGVLLISRSMNKSYLCISLCLPNAVMFFQLNISYRLADVWHLWCVIL